MEFIPGPRAPTYAHLHIPFLCAVEDLKDFPLESQYNKDNHWFHGTNLLTQYYVPPGKNQELTKQIRATAEAEGKPLEDREFAIIDKSDPGYYNVPAQGTTDISSLRQRATGPGWFRDFPRNEYDFDDQGLQCDWRSSAYKSAWNQKNPKTTAVFIQDWLYFALLGEVLGRLVTYDEFITPVESSVILPWIGKFPNDDHLLKLTTRRFLEDSEWKSWADAIYELSEPERDARVRNIKYALSQAQKFCLLEDAGELTQIPFSGHLAVSIRALGLLFEDVCHNHPSLFFRSEENIEPLSWGIGNLISARMARTGIESSIFPVQAYAWCPNDIARLRRELPATAMYYLSSVSRNPGLLKARTFEGIDSDMRPINEQGRDHTACTEESCRMDNIDANTYLSEHFPACDGNCGWVGPDMKKVQDILHRGKIPLIRFSPANPAQGPFTSLKADAQELVNGGKPLFEKAMQLSYTCGAQYKQSERFSQENGRPFLGKVDTTFHDLGIDNTAWEFDVIEYDAEGKTPYVAISHVWSDGLGNNVGNEIPRCRMPFLQRVIWQSRGPITRTSPINFPSEDLQAANLDIDYAIVVGMHQARELVHEPIYPFWLDTFCVPKAVEMRSARNTALQLMGSTYDLALKVVVLDQEFCGQNIGGHGVMRRYRATPPIEQIAQLLGAKWMRRLWTLQEGLLAKELLIMFAEGPVDIKAIIHWTRSYAQASEPGSLVARQLARGIERMLDFQEADVYHRLLRVWNASVGRTASRPGDVPTSMAGSIGLDAGIVDAANAVDRSRIFYSLLDGIPQSIIFSGAAKLHDAGFRWADKLVAKKFLDVNSPPGKILRNPWCLEVSYPTYVTRLNPSLPLSSIWTEQDELLELKMDLPFNSAPLPDGMYLLILDRPCLAEEYDVGHSFKVVIITQDLSDETGADVGHIEGFGTLDLIEQHPPRHDENDGPVLVDLGISTWRLM